MVLSMVRHIKTLVHKKYYTYPNWYTLEGSPAATLISRIDSIVHNSRATPPFTAKPVSKGLINQLTENAFVPLAALVIGCVLHVASGGGMLARLFSCMRVRLAIAVLVSCGDPGAYIF